MTSAYDVIYKKLTPTSQVELDEKRGKFETLISEIQKRNSHRVLHISELMKTLVAYSQTEFTDMSAELITEIKQAANSYKQSAGKRKKTYKRSSTKKSKSRRNKTRK